MHLKKVEKLKNGKQLFVFFSNDKGSGKNNCTIQLVEGSEKRKLTAKLTKDVLKEVYTTSWKGDINFSKRIQRILDVNVSDLMRYKEIKKIDSILKVSQDEAWMFKFDIIWMKIQQKAEKNGGSNVAIISREQLKSFSRSMYSQGWKDQIFWEGQRNGILAEINK